MQVKNKTEYYSLYEYLGRAAGGDLGTQVNEVATKTKQPFITQRVSNPNFEGEVFCYTKNFLNEYFNNDFDHEHSMVDVDNDGREECRICGASEVKTTESDDNNDLPF